MKFWFYGIALALLPIIYVGLMYFTGEPIEWSVLVFMALILPPLLIFRRKITSIEQEFNAMPDQKKMKVIAKTAEKIVRKAASSD